MNAVAPILSLEDACVSRLELLAADVGRLRRRIRATEPAASSIGYTADRIAAHVEAFVLMFAPTAAELYRHHLAICGDEEIAVETALDDADVYARTLTSRLGGRPT